MASYTVTDPTGLSLQVDGDRAPTEPELTSIFAEAQKRGYQAPAADPNARPANEADWTPDQARAALAEEARRTFADPKSGVVDHALGAFIAGTERSGLGRALTKAIGVLPGTDQFNREAALTAYYQPETTAEKFFHSMGGFFQGLPLMEAGGGLVGLAGKAAGLGPLAARLATSAGGFSAMNAGDTALDKATDAPGADQRSVLDEAAKGALGGLALGGLGAPASKLASLGRSVVDPLVLNATESAYDAAVNGKPLPSPSEYGTASAGQIPVFLALNLLHMHGLPATASEPFRNIADPAVAPDARVKAAKQIATLIDQHDPQLAQQFWEQSLAAIAKGQPLDLKLDPRQGLVIDAGVHSPGLAAVRKFLAGAGSSGQQSDVSGQSGAELMGRSGAGAAGEPNGTGTAGGGAPLPAPMPPTAGPPAPLPASDQRSALRQAQGPEQGRGTVSGQPGQAGAAQHPVVAAVGEIKNSLDKLQAAITGQGAGESSQRSAVSGQAKVTGSGNPMPESVASNARETLLQLARMGGEDTDRGRQALRMLLERTGAKSEADLAQDYPELHAAVQTGRAAGPVDLREQELTRLQKFVADTTALPAPEPTDPRAGTIMKNRALQLAQAKAQMEFLGANLKPETGNLSSGSTGSSQTGADVTTEARSRQAGGGEGGALGQPALPEEAQRPPTPETDAQLQAQVENLKAGHVPAVAFTEGEDASKFPLPSGMAATGVQVVEPGRAPYRATVYFDPAKLTAEQIHAAAANNKMGDVLDYGIPSKPANPVGVVRVHDKNGTPVREVLTDEANAPAVTAKAQALAQAISGKVGTATAEQAIGEREAGSGPAEADSGAAVPPRPESVAGPATDQGGAPGGRALPSEIWRQTRDEYAPVPARGERSAFDETELKTWQQRRVEHKAAVKDALASGQLDTKTYDELHGEAYGAARSTEYGKNFPGVVAGTRLTGDEAGTDEFPVVKGADGLLRIQNSGRPAVRDTGYNRTQLKVQSQSLTDGKQFDTLARHPDFGYQDEPNLQNTGQMIQAMAGTLPDGGRLRTARVQAAEAIGATPEQLAMLRAEQTTGRDSANGARVRQALLPKLQEAQAAKTKAAIEPLPPQPVNPADLNHGDAFYDTQRGEWLHVKVDPTTGKKSVIDGVAIPAEKAGEMPAAGGAVVPREMVEPGAAGGSDQPFDKLRVPSKVEGRSAISDQQTTKTQKGSLSPGDPLAMRDQMEATPSALSTEGNPAPGEVKQGDAVLPSVRRRGELPSGLRQIDDPQRAAEAIRSLQADVTESVPTERDGIVYGTVDAGQNNLYRQKGAPDVSGYRHVIDNYGIRHATNEHGSAATETPRGQLPETADDFAAVPQVTRAENLVDVQTNRRGQQVLLYQKRVNGHLYAAEEVQDGRGNLVLASLRKKMAEGNVPTIPGDAQSPLRSTPLPTPEGTPGSGNVKPGTGADALSTVDRSADAPKGRVGLTKPFVEEVVAGVRKKLGIDADVKVRVGSLAEAQAWQAEHPNAAVRATDLGDKEGFYDPASKTAFVIHDGIERRPNETPKQAVARVVLHELSGHAGVEQLLGKDVAFSKLWAGLQKQITPDELDAVAKDRPDLANWRSDPAQAALARKEWFAQQAEGAGNQKMAAWHPLVRKAVEFANNAIERLFGVRLRTPDVAELLARSNAALRGAGRELTTETQSAQRGEARPEGGLLTAGTGRELTIQGLRDRFGSEIPHAPTAVNARTIHDVLTGKRDEGLVTTTHGSFVFAWGTRDMGGYHIVRNHYSGLKNGITADELLHLPDFLSRAQVDPRLSGSGRTVYETTEQGIRYRIVTQDVDGQPHIVSFFTNREGQLGGHIARPSTDLVQRGESTPATGNVKPGGDGGLLASQRARKPWEEEEPADRSQKSEVRGQNAGSGTVGAGRSEGVARQLVHDAQDFMSVDSTPKLRRVSPALAVKAREMAYAPAAITPMVNDKLSEIFPDTYNDPEAMARTVRVLNMDRILGDYDRRVAAADWFRKNDQPAEAAKYGALARDIREAHDLPGMQALVKEAMTDPQLMADVGRWKKATAELDQFYGELKQVDKWSHDTGTGRNLGAHINLLALKGEEAAARRQQLEAESPSVASPRGSATNVKKDPWARMAKATADYSDDARANLEKVYQSRWPNVTKLRFYNELIKSGAAVPETPDLERPETIQGQPVAKLELNLPETDPKTGIVRNVPQNLYLRGDLLEETRRALRTDLDSPMHPLAKVLNQVQLAQIADPVAHAKNQHTLIANLPALRADWQTVLRKMPVLGSGWAIKQVHDVMRDITADTPAIRKELADMARAGLLRQPSESAGISKWIKTHEFLQKTDMATRVIMNRFFTEAVQSVIAQDTPENRAKFVTQVGEYNTRLMGDLTARAKQSGLSPFVVAGRAFNRAGRRLLAGEPGFEATSTGAGAKVRTLNILSGVIGAAAIPMMLNLVTTGTVGGRAGTPLGAWDLGRDEKDGKHTVADLLQLTGLRRGLRATGMNALIEGLRAGKSWNQIGGDMLSDVGRSTSHPYLGPAVGFVTRAGLGVNPDMRGGPQPTTARNMGGGIAQFLEQGRVAMQNQNPLVYSLVAPALGDTSQGYATGVGKATWKAPGGALGIAELRSPAQLLAFEKLRALRPVGGYTTAQGDRSQLRREIVDLFATDPEAARQKFSEAKTAGQLTSKDAQAIGEELAGSTSPLLRAAQRLQSQDPAGLKEIYDIASPAEKQQLQPMMAHHELVSQARDLRKQYGVNDVRRSAVIKATVGQTGLSAEQVGAAYDQWQMQQPAQQSPANEVARAIVTGEPPQALADRLAAQGITGEAATARWLRSVENMGRSLAAENDDLRTAVARARRDPAVDEATRQANVSTLLREAALQHYQALAGKTARAPTVAELRKVLSRQ